MIAAIAAVLALTCFGAGCQFPVAEQASAEVMTTRSHPGAARLPETLPTYSPSSLTDHPAKATGVTVQTKTPPFAEVYVSQSDTAGSIAGSNPRPLYPPVPTPTPVPLADWMARNPDVPPEMASDLHATEWASDGIDLQEGRVIAALVELTAGSDPALTLAEWLAMPFLHTLEPADDAALQALLSVHRNDPEAYRAIMKHETIKASITDQWTPVIAGLPGPRIPTRGRYTVPASLVDQLLDPSVVTIEERTIYLPLAGPVTVAVVRTAPGSGRSIERLTHAIRAAEGFIQEPFPIKHVTMLFADWPGEFPVVAINNHHSMTASTILDVGEGARMALQSKYIIAHETAHFYWTGHPDWLDEAAAELIARAATASDEDPYRPHWECDLSESLTTDDLETLQLHPEHPGYSCNYATGLRHLTDMRDGLGASDFMVWLRAQYRNQP